MSRPTSGRIAPLVRLHIAVLVEVRKLVKSVGYALIATEPAAGGSLGAAGPMP